MKSLLLASLVTLATAGLAVAQEPSLFLGGMEMRLGMQQTIIMDHLSKYYDLRRFTSPNSYVIYERKRTEDDELKTIGQVAFDKGRLTFAVKEWYYAVGSGFKLVDVLHGVLNQAEQRGETVATIETRTMREPNMTIQEIKLGFGKKWIIISAIDSKGSKNVRVDEIIRFAPFPK